MTDSGQHAKSGLHSSRSQGVMESNRVLHRHDGLRTAMNEEHRRVVRRDVGLGTYQAGEFHPLFHRSAQVKSQIFSDPRKLRFD